MNECRIAGNFPAMETKGNEYKTALMSDDIPTDHAHAKINQSIKQ
jgi:hypothetical protein